MTQENTSFVDFSVREQLLSDVYITLSLRSLEGKFTFTIGHRAGLGITVIS